MQRPLRTSAALMLGLLGLTLLAACGGTTDTDGQATGAAVATTTATAPAVSSERDVTTINGTVPLGEMLPLRDVTTMLDTIESGGQRLVITRGVRLAGTRAAIHVHQYGGSTCVVSGTITDFVEGRDSNVFPAGTCYYMPPNTLMTAANLGAEDAVLIDTFTLPPGAPTITIREPGWPG